jgi:hypothetical protein
MLHYRLKNFLYCDTDSIIYFTSLRKKYIGKDIGLLKLVDKIDYGYFLSSYYYYKSGTRYIIKARGFIKKVSPILDSNTYKFKLFINRKRIIKPDLWIKELIFNFNYKTKITKIINERKISYYNYWQIY